ALAVLGALWLWGGVAGALFGGGWIHVSLGQLVGVLIRIPGHLTDPARAWPAPARGHLPGTGGFYAALALLAATAGAVCAVSARAGLWAALRRGDGARWAATGELRRLRGSAGAGRLTLGWYRGRLLHAEERHALVAFGPPQSGKSAGLAVPALLEWEGPAVASSIKTDLLAGTQAR